MLLASFRRYMGLSAQTEQNSASASMARSWGSMWPRLGRLDRASFACFQTAASTRGSQRWMVLPY